MEGAREVAWAISRVGSARELDGEFDDLVRDLERSCKSLFPKRQGYHYWREDLREGSVNLVRLHVRRGDFAGHVQLCRESEAKLAVVRASASACSERLTLASRRGERAVVRTRTLATALGILLGVAFCWFAARGDVMMPVVSGLLLTVVTGTLVLASNSLGLRIGEGIASRLTHEAALAIQADHGVQADLKRWNSLGRQLRFHRRALSRGLQGAPFRRAL